jgi:hypothetical protein
VTRARDNSYRDMAIADGVASDDPALARCHGNGIDYDTRSRLRRRGTPLRDRGRARTSLPRR